MSNYNPPQDNPWSDPARETLSSPQTQNQQSLGTNNPFYQQSHSPNPWATGQEQNSGYAPPPGPPPGHQSTPFSSGHEQTYASEGQTQNPQPQYGQQSYDQQGYGQQPSYGSNQQSYNEPAPGLPPRRAGTFEETDFVPASERGEQREMMEHFEMSNSHAPSTDDRNVETLQREFPGLDGSLVAAIYGDSKDMGATREMLRELSGK